MSLDKSQNSKNDQVSLAYKTIANERVPDELNRKILQQAERASKESTNPASTWTRWSRPMAWAATIGLTLAIVLDLTRLTIDPAIDEELRDEAVPEVSAAEPSIREEFAPKNPDVMEAAREQAELRFGPNQQPEAPAKAVDQRATTPQHEEAAGSVEMQQLKKEADLPAPIVESEATSSADAASRSRNQRLQFSQLGGATVDLESDADSVASELCGEAIRESENDWLECIQQLRRNGLEAEADRQYAELLVKFRSQ